MAQWPSFEQACLSGACWTLLVPGPTGSLLFQPSFASSVCPHFLLRNSAVLPHTTGSARPHLTAGAPAQPHSHPVFLSQAPVCSCQPSPLPFTILFQASLSGPCVPCQWLTHLLKGLGAENLNQWALYF